MDKDIFHNLNIDRIEPITIEFKTTGPIEPNSLIRIRGTIGTMFTAFNVIDIWQKETDIKLPIIHKFSPEQLQDDWMFYMRLRSLAVAKTADYFQSGTIICVNIEPIKKPISAPGIKGKWLLEIINDLYNLEGKNISHSVNMSFISGSEEYIEAYQKVNGELIVKWFDSYGYPITDNQKQEQTIISEKQNTNEILRVKVSTSQGFKAISSALPKSISGIPIYFGDFHWHTNFTDGALDLATTLVNARDHIGLDFAGPGDHMGGSGKFGDRYYSEQADICHKFNEPDRFCTLPTVEITNRYGHVHVITENFDYMEQIISSFSKTILPATQTQANKFPWEALVKLCSEGKVILRPNHPNVDSEIAVNPEDKRVLWYSFNWPRDVEHKLIRLVEIVRSGSHETEETEEDWPIAGGGFGGSVRTALTRGYRIGFTGGSDNHQGWPGREALTAVQSSELDMTSIFNALYQRRCYATTGAHIIADATLNNQPIGSELILEPDVPRKIKIRINGTEPIVQVQIISANSVVADLPIIKDSLDFEYEGVDERPGRHLENIYYYVRARQKDGHCVWLSPFWVDLPK